MSERKPWREYFFDLADMAATRATCPRLHAGVVLVKNNRVLATGYNGSQRGEEHCEDVGCDMEDGHCVRTIHAEVNAILQAAITGVSIEDCFAYVTHTPCRNCAKLFHALSISTFYRSDYP